MEKVLLFNSPVKIDINRDGEAKGIISTIYGFKLPACSYSLLDLKRYTEYLCAISMWEKEGGHFNAGTWISKDDTVYHTDNAEIQNYLHQVLCEMNMSANLYETDMTLEPGGMLDEFIIDSGLHQSIQNNARFVDVVINPDHD